MWAGCPKCIQGPAWVLVAGSAYPEMPVVPPLVAGTSYFPFLPFMCPKGLLNLHLKGPSQFSEELPGGQIAPDGQHTVFIFSFVGSCETGPPE